MVAITKKFVTFDDDGKRSSHITGAVLGRPNTSSEQPPPNIAAANFVVIANGEVCALNGTAVATVFIDQ